jgi:hypothetical protein
MTVGMFRPFVMALAACVVAGTTPAYASIESELVQKGIAAYDDLDYQKSIDLLTKALNETLTREEKLATYKTLAFAHVAVDKPASAQADFESLLRVDPTFQLDRTISPRVRSVFDAAQAKVATGGLTTGDSRLHPEVGPRAPKEGHPLSIRLSYPGGVATKMELFYRTRGQNRFNKLEERPLGGLFTANIPGTQVAGPAFEYYIILIDDTGSGVASAGSLGQPLAVDVQGKPRPIAKNPAFWGGLVAGVVVVGVVAGVLGATLPSHIGPDTPATLTIKPQ